MENSGKPLQGKRVAMLMTDGVEQIEYTSPRSFLEGQGATVVLLSPKAAGEESRVSTGCSPPTSSRSR
jgi:protease I